MPGIVRYIVLAFLVVDLVTATDYNNLLLNLGLGYNFSCQPIINTVLESADEYSKAGMSSATTLITLIPALLTIGNLYVPRSSEAFATSWIIGLLSAAFGLGLPVQSIRAVPRTRVVDLRDLPKVDRDDLRRYGIAIQGKQRDWPSWAIPLSELHSWFLAQHGNSVGWTIVNRSEDFRILKARAHRYTERNHYWYLPTVIISLVQLLLFAAAGFSTTNITLSQPLWSCASEFNLMSSPETGTTI